MWLVEIVVVMPVGYGDLFAFSISAALITGDHLPTAGLEVVLSREVRLWAG